MKIRAIITGATGMVGEGVLHECLQHPEVERVLIINRRPSGFSDPKLEEVVHNDFHNLTQIENRLSGYNACYFCLGVSSIGMNEADYTRTTYELARGLASTLLRLNPVMVFCYVSGAGTDSTESGKSMWARVKGRTENMVLTTGFRDAYAFRPGFMKPTPGLKNTLSVYIYVNWMFPLLRKVFPRHVCTLAEVGQAMINVTLRPTEKKILEVKDIVAIANH